MVSNQKAAEERRLISNDKPQFIFYENGEGTEKKKFKKKFLFTMSMKIEKEHGKKKIFFESSDFQEKKNECVSNLCELK